MAGADQQALDGGSWTLAEHLLLVPGPPFSAFANRKSHQFDAIDSYHTKLFEPQWAELCLHRVKELEQHLEARRNSGTGTSRLLLAPMPVQTNVLRSPSARAEKAQKAPPGVRRNDFLLDFRVGFRGLACLWRDACPAGALASTVCRVRGADIWHTSVIFCIASPKCIAPSQPALTWIPGQGALHPSFAGPSRNSALLCLK